MATKKVETALTFKQNAIAAAIAAIGATAKAKGYSKTFTANVLRLGVLSSPEAAQAAEELGKALTDLAGGKGYASNAKRILSAGVAACRKALDHCEDPQNSGFMAPGNLFKTFPDDFPALTTSGRGKKEEPAKVEGVDLATPAGWLTALEAIRAKVNGQKAWKSEDIVAMQESATTMIALVKRNKV